MKSTLTTFFLASIVLALMTQPAFIGAQLSAAPRRYRSNQRKNGMQRDRILKGMSMSMAFHEIETTTSATVPETITTTTSKSAKQPPKHSSTASTVPSTSEEDEIRGEFVEQQLKESSSSMISPIFFAAVTGAWIMML